MGDVDDEDDSGDPEKRRRNNELKLRRLQLELSELIDEESGGSEDPDNKDSSPPTPTSPVSSILKSLGFK